jgi:Transposase DDE domain
LGDLHPLKSPCIAALLASLIDVLNSDQFCQAHRVNARDFTRKRCLTLPTLVVFLLQQVGGKALQKSLDCFFMALGATGKLLRVVSKSAFSQARKKLKPCAFAALNSMWVQAWWEAGHFDLWFHRRVLAADGTCLRLPHLRENSDKYGLGPVENGSVAMARCVALFCVASKQWIEVIVGRYDQGERELLLQSLAQVKANDVLVLDRGYPAWWLFAAMQLKGVDFCARIEGCGWTCAQKLLRSERSELVVEPRLNASQRAKVLELGLVVPERVKLRLVKVQLPEGRGVQVVATSLMDTQKFPTHAFGELYRKRWGIEEGFKLLKHRQHLEGFSGELPESIEQEIGAKMLLNNIAQAVAHQAKRDVTKADKERWAVNAAYALKQAGPVVVCAFKGVATVLKRSVKALTGVLSKTLERIRPNRSFPRDHAIGGAQRPRKTYR